MVTRAEAERIIAEPKVIGANLSWKKEGQGHRLEAKVLCEESGEMLVLKGYQGKRNRSFALLYRNEPIRKYTVHPYHIDPVTRERFTGPHKHYWDDEWEDRRVYIPTDIRMGDPEEELVDFLAECNIELRAQTFLAQQSKEGDSS